MYRVLDTEKKNNPIFSSVNPNAEDNCLDWQRRTSPDIPLTDIYKVVYTMPLETYENLYKDIYLAHDSDNAFIKWMSYGKWEEFKFLLFAKTTEDVRSRQNSRWYYPSMKTGARMSLEDIAEHALNYHGKLRDRYLLQGIRALFSLRRYEDCIDLWNNEISLYPKGSVMRQMILTYIAGAEYRMGNYDKAASYYVEVGDFASMIACSHGNIPSKEPDVIEQIYQYDPNNKWFPKILQEFVRQAEPTGNYDFESNENYVSSEYRQLAKLAIRIAQEGRTDNPAMWYYTAAFIEDLDGNTARASQLLSKAEMSRGTDFIKESVKVMRIYLDAKQMPYNQEYENRLFGQLKWLDRKIVGNITAEVREKTADLWHLREGHSYYYWNDMMRRILLSEVCPRMISAGKPIRALQLANMADNRLFGLVDSCTVSYGKTCSMREYRWHNDTRTPDYSNSFFEMIDSVGLKHVIEYRNRIISPKSTFERFLNERGYVDMDYINDIVGTQCLRAMRYADAVNYLAKVNRAFDGHLNTHLSYDPFSYKQRIIDDGADFKYRFAREMAVLEQEIRMSSDSDRKAEAMIRYAIGIRNSFDWCWPLTQYYLGSWFYGQVQEKRCWATEPEAIHAKKRSDELLLTACSLFNNRELAAKALYELNQYRTVAEKYPETQMGLYVQGHCDNLCDYAL